MQEIFYCGQCGIANPATSKFCGQCGAALVAKVDTKAIEYEYQSFDWRVHSNSPRDCVMARKGIQATSDSNYPMSETEARNHFWQKYQKVILVDFQKWLDAGWKPISEVGPSCVVIEASTQNESFGILSLLKDILIPHWCFVGATIKVRKGRNP